MTLTLHSNKQPALFEALTLSIHSDDLLALPTDTVCNLILKEKDFKQILFLARLGGLANGRRAYISNTALPTPYVNLSLHQDLYRKVLINGSPVSDSEQVDLLFAAAEGINRLEHLSGLAITPAEKIVAQFFTNTSSNINKRRYSYDNTVNHGVLESSFLDPRISFSMFNASILLEPILGSNMNHWEQLKSKEGFTDFLLTNFQDNSELSRAIMSQSVYPKEVKINPGMDALKILYEQKALPVAFIRDIGYTTKIQQPCAQMALKYANILWPDAAYDPASPSSTIQRALQSQASDSDIELFFSKACLADFENDTFKDYMGALPYDSCRLWKMATLLPAPYFTRFVNAIDSKGPQCWAKWLEGEGPSISLDGKSSKTVDLMTGLCFQKHEALTIDLVVKNIESFTFSMTKASIRWLKERSLNATSFTAITLAKETLNRVLPLAESFELRHLTDPSKKKNKTIEEPQLMPSHRPRRAL